MRYIGSSSRALMGVRQLAVKPSGARTPGAGAALPASLRRLFRSHRRNHTVLSQNLIMGMEISFWCRLGIRLNRLYCRGTRFESGGLPGMLRDDKLGFSESFTPDFSCTLIEGSDSILVVSKSNRHESMHIFPYISWAPSGLMRLNSTPIRSCKSHTCLKCSKHDSSSVLESRLHLVL